MDSDSLSAESAFPPPPPLLPPPAPPPVVAVGKGQVEASALWRWNDRLALVVAGLTLFLLGIFAGRLFGPGQSSSEPVVVASVPAAQEVAPEVNPPLILENAPPEIISPPGPPPAPAAAPKASEVTVEKTEETKTSEP